jgi:hypothetical protein
MVWIVVAATWFLLAVGASLLVGRGIRLADLRAAEDRTERNFVVDGDPLAAPLPPLPRSAGHAETWAQPPVDNPLPHRQGF